MHLRKGKGRDTVCLFYLWWADFHHFSNMKNPCMFLVPNIWRVVGGTDWAVFCMCYNLMCSSSVGCSVEGLWELEKLGSLENVHFLSILEARVMQFKRHEGEHEEAGRDTGFEAVFLPCCVSGSRVSWWRLHQSRLCLGWWAEWWWLSVCLVLAFADEKRRDYSHDANVFLQVNCITWPGLLHQCPPLPVL